MSQTFAKPITESRFLGLNDAVPTEELSPGYFSKIDNAICSDGKVSKVAGSSAAGASISANPFNGLAPLEIFSSSTKYLVVSINGASNAQLYRWNGSGNWVAIGSANLTNSKPVWFETANNILFGFNGTEVVDYDGTTVTVNRASVPIGFFGKWFHNYLFVASTAAQPNRLFWSDLGDPTTFTGSNLVDINPGDSDQIMGLVGIQDELLVFKKDTIWSITGFSGTTFSSTTIATQNTNVRINGYGTVAPFSIVPVGNDVYFFSMLGSTPVIRSLYKTINSVTLGAGVISQNIKNTLANITLANLSQIVGDFDGRYVYWSIPINASTTNNEIIVLDTWEITKRGLNTNYPFTTMSQKNASYFAVSTIPGYSTVYFTDASATSGLVFKFDSSIHTDNGVNTTMDVRTRDYSSGGSRKTKFKYLYLTYTSGLASLLQIGAKIDEGLNFANQTNLSMQGLSPGLGSFILGTSTLGGETLTTTRITFKHILCHYLSLQYLDTTANAVVLHKWEVWPIPKPLRNN